MAFLGGSSNSDSKGSGSGSKGGSPCASAIVNALYKLLRQGTN